MPDLKIRIYKGLDQHLASTVTIPGGVLRIARNFVPHRAVEALRREGIELDELARLSESDEAHGTLVEVEDHEKGERVVVALE
jgi:hypothetical protein